MRINRKLKTSKATCFFPLVCIVGTLSFLCCREFCLNEPLWIAAYTGKVAKVKFLLSIGANPNSLGEDGTTALETAKQHEYAEIVRILQQAGAKENNRK